MRQPVDAARLRGRYATLAGLAVLLGLTSRRFRAVLPGWVGLYAGDVLWALLVLGLVSLAWPRGAVRRRAGLAAVWALATELSQLWQAPWLQALRATRLGALVLGRGFLWSDLGCYAIGIALGWALDGWLRRGRSGWERGARRLIRFP